MTPRETAIGMWTMFEQQHFQPDESEDHGQTQLEVGEAVHEVGEQTALGGVSASALWGARVICLPRPAGCHPRSPTDPAIHQAGAGR